MYCRSHAESSRVDLESGFVMFDVQDLANASQSDIAKRATKKRRAQAVYIAALKNVESLERMLKIEVQWHPESDEYKATLRRYSCAITCALSIG